MHAGKGIASLRVAVLFERAGWLTRGFGLCGVDQDRMAALLAMRPTERQEALEHMTDEERGDTLRHVPDEKLGAILADLPEDLVNKASNHVELSVCRTLASSSVLESAVLRCLPDKCHAGGSRSGFDFCYGGGCQVRADLLDARRLEPLETEKRRKCVLTSKTALEKAQLLERMRPLESACTITAMSDEEAGSVLSLLPSQTIVDVLSGMGRGEHERAWGVMDLPMLREVMRLLLCPRDAFPPSPSDDRHSRDSYA